MASMATDYYARGGNTMERELRIVFAGGPILTMVEGTPPEAVAVIGKRIVHTGTVEECRRAAGPGHQEVDLAGRTLMPGIVDAHAHLLAFGQLSRMADLRYPAVKSIEDLVETMRRHALTVGPEARIVGFGYDHNKLAEKRHPTAADLDRVAKDRPVYVVHVSCHYVVANTFLMAQHNITAATPDPPGGAIGRDEAGRPNGVFFDAATQLVLGDGVRVGTHGPNFHFPTPLQDLVECVRVGSQAFAAAGVTTVVDPQVTRREMEGYLAARAAGVLKNRVVMMYLSSYLDLLIEMGMRAPIGDDFVSFGPVKFYADGTLTGGTARFTCPYCFDPNWLGAFYHEPEALAELIFQAHEFGLQTATHAQGDAAIQAVIDAVQRAQKRFPRDGARHRIEHCGVPRADQIAQIRDAGIWPIAQPYFIWEIGDGVKRNIGAERARGLIPLASFRQHGIPLVLSSDSPVADFHPFRVMAAAITRVTQEGDVLGPEQAVGVEDCLRAYTLNAAASVFREHDLGSIEPGKQADFIVIDRNPVECGPDELAETEVLQTWVAGRQVFAKGGFSV